MVWPTDHDTMLSEYDAMELPGQQLPAATAITPLDHYLKLDVKAPPGCQRLTGIVATMGKSTNDPEIMEQMMAAGMNIALINFTFGTKEEHTEMIKTLRQAVKNYSIKIEKNYPLAIAGLLAGRKIRTGRIADFYVRVVYTLVRLMKTQKISARDMVGKLLISTLVCVTAELVPIVCIIFVICFPNYVLDTLLDNPDVAELPNLSYGEAVELKTGEAVRLTSDETYKERCSTYTVFIDFMYLADQVKKGTNILLDNETISLTVEVVSSTTITCKIVRGGFLGSYKDVFIPNLFLKMPNFSEKDKVDIEMAKHLQIDVLIAPFVNDAEAITELKALLGEKGKKIAIVSQIQTIEGYKNFDQILAVTNGIMISRQELGSDITPKKLVLVQKNMIARANQANIPVSLSAQILSSMRHRTQPLRAELLDVSNCVLDGVDSLVLTAETAVGQYPVETIACLSSACKEAEACVWTKQVYSDMIDKTPIPCDQTTAIALAVVLASHRTIAAAIVVVTSTGEPAHIVSRFKPRCPIVAVTRYPQVARQLHMWRGIVPLVYEDQPDPDWRVDIDTRVAYAAKWMMARGFVRVGDPLVVMTGWREGTGYTNTMRVIYATADY